VSREPVTEEETQAPDAVAAASSSDADGAPTAASEFVEITVADDGPGIPDIELDVLAENQETPLKHGSGLGLWLIDWLVDHLDGELTFESREPRGTIVTVRLPREPP
jgi:signal transduction histidine kinase